MPENPRVSLPQTQHSVFYAYSININGNEIGSFERLSMRASKNAERIREVLYSHGAETKEIVWGATDISVDLSKVEIYRQCFQEAMGFALGSLEDINTPVDIVEVQTNPVSGEKRVVAYKDCVATSWSKSIDTGTAKLVEEMTFEVRTVRTHYQ